MDAPLHIAGAGAGAGCAPALTLVHVRLGELAIGVDARFVLHALPRPARLARLPRSHGAIDGVFMEGERTVPLVDLRTWMGVPPDPAAPPGHVLVLGAEGRTIGLAIDAAWWRCASRRCGASTGKTPGTASSTAWRRPARIAFSACSIRCA